MNNIFKTFFRTMASKKPTFGIPTYQSIDYSLEDIRVYLSKYTGGSVDLNLDEASGIATICLCHPEKKNSITGKMMVDLESAVKQLEDWESGKGVLIVGANNYFCSGGDLNFAKKTGTPEGGYKMATFMQNVLGRLQQLPMITVAFIEGSALGGGAEVAMACDFRVFANNDAGLGFVHARMGLIPAWGGMTMAVRRLGYGVALDLVTTARMVHAAEAQTLGLCDAVVGDLVGAQGWLAHHTQWHTSVVRAAKCVAQRSLQGSPDALDQERRMFAPLWGGPANQLALSQNIKHK